MIYTLHQEAEYPSGFSQKKSCLLLIFLQKFGLWRILLQKILPAAHFFS